jgi:2-oxo-4-hydroxy-4-carboxy--5-ureidoimidazoline (OHCU) decarboxylase
MATPNENEMSVEMQKAAVQVAVNQGKTHDAILKEHPHLAKGVAALKKESEKPAKPRRTGAVLRRTSGIRPRL